MPAERRIGKNGPGAAGCALSEVRISAGVKRWPLFPWSPSVVGAWNPAARATSAKRSGTYGRSYLWDAIFKGLSEDLEDMTFELGQLVQKEDIMMGQRHLAWHWQLSPANQADVRDGVRRGATRPGRYPGGLAPGQPGDAVDAGGLEILIQGHRRQDGGMTLST
jgi:hypothetical protein